MKILQFWLFLVLLVIPLVPSQAQGADYASTIKYTPKNIAIGAAACVAAYGIKSAAEYGIGMVSTLIHELSHAIIARILCDSPIDIVIGAHPHEDGAPAKFKIGPIAFHRLLAYGYAKTFPEEKEYSAGQKTSVCLAGPVAGALFAAKARDFVCQRPMRMTEKNPALWWFNFIVWATFIKEEIRHWLALKPLGEDMANDQSEYSDGDIIAQTLNVHPKVITLLAYSIIAVRGCSILKDFASIKNKG